MRASLLVAVLSSACNQMGYVHHPITECVDYSERHPHLASGRYFDVTNIRRLHVFDSTEEDAECVLGRPTARTSMGSRTSLTWSYMERRDDHVHQVIAIGTFDTVTQIMTDVPITRETGDPIDDDSND